LATTNNMYSPKILAFLYLHLFAFPPL
jgi:hypothetical protein